MRHPVISYLNNMLNFKQQIDNCFSDEDTIQYRHTGE